MDRNTIIGLSIALLTVVWAISGSSESAKKDADKPQSPEKPARNIAYGTPLIDGDGADPVWQSAEWVPLNQCWAGTMPAPADFQGRYKVIWDENMLYVLAEIQDDALVDTHPDGLLKYWDDDCLEIFVDEDASGGEHQYNYNAFAYHIALDGKVVDIAPDKSYQYFNDHCTTRRITRGNTSIWEVAMKIFDGNRYEDGGDNAPKMLRAGKKMGFMLAYCDNDHSPEREHFMGDVVIEGQDKNRGWIDATVFGAILLSE
jgi:hypothetical protein